MNRKSISAALMALAAFLSCNPGNPNVPGSEKPVESSLWALRNDLVESVQVYCGKTLVQSFKYEYDEKNNLLTRITRTDEIIGIPVYDLSLAYEGNAGLAVSGNHYYRNSSLKASLSEGRDALQYGPDGTGTLLTLDSDDLPAMCLTESLAACGKYSSQAVRKTGFTTDGGDITVVRIRTGIESQTLTATSAVSESEVQYEYTYSDREDLQNFAAYLMPCDFPVWMAAELPGCAHLITGMTSKCGGVTLPESFTVEYSFNDNGSINSAVRTDCSRGETVCQLKYVFSYL